MKKILLSLLTVFAFSIQAQVVSTFPLIENFDGMATCGTGCGTACPLSNGWTNELNDDIDWTVDAGGTGSSNTGPSFDNTQGATGNGNYVYTEASGCVTDTALMTSPFLNLVGQPNFFLEYYHHSYGSQINNLYVEVSNDGGVTWTFVDSAIGVPPGINAWQFRQVNLSSYVNDTIKVRFRGISGTSFGSDLALDDIKLYSLFQIDAGITSLDAPTNPITPGLNLFSATIRNFGVDTLVKDSIGWSVNGVIQPSAVWSGNLAINQSSINNFVGSANLPTGLSKVKLWNKLPNDSVDQNHANDTIEVFLCTSLNGIYTVGGVNPDFTDIPDAVNALIQCGISGPVIFDIAPGNYTADVTIPPIFGSSATNTVTFLGDDTSTTYVSSSTISFDIVGADNITFKKFTLNNSGSVDAYGFRLSDTAEFITIDSCRISMFYTPGISDVVAVGASSSTTSTFGEGQNANWTTVSNCHITGGEKGIHFEGQNALNNIGNRFINNLIDNVDDYGFYIDDQDSLMIYGNTISNLRTANGADAIYCFDIQTFDISYNTAYNVPDWGIYIADGNFSLDKVPTSRARIVNNMMSSVSDYAFYADDFETTDVYHNTFHSSTTGRTAYFNDLADIDMRNNIFSNDASGYAFYSLDPITGITNLTLDYNLYFGATAVNKIYDGGTNHPNLASWQTAVTTQNQNSTETDPVYLNGGSDMHVLSPIANDLGDNSVGIVDDFEGDTRPLGLNVDMGADEFTPDTANAAFVSFIKPDAIICGDSVTPIIVVVRNLADTIFGMNITVDVTGDLVQTLNYSYNDTLAFNNYDTVTVGTINTYWGTNYNLTAYVSLLGDQNLLNDTGRMSFLARPYEPQGLGGYLCDSDTSYALYAPSLPGTMYGWYDTIVGGTLLGMGDSIFIPNYNNVNDTLYLEYLNNADSLTTGFPGGNGQVGNMFDVVALNTVTIQSFDGNLNAGTHATINIWYRTGSHVGFENSSAGWTLIGTATNVVSAGNGVGTPIPLPINLTIPAGQTYAFYVEASNSVAYTNGTAVGNVWASNSDLQILEGVGKGANFVSTFTPRNWNGTIHYGSTGCSTIRTPVTYTKDTSATAAFTYSSSSNTVTFNSAPSMHEDSVWWDFGDGNFSNMPNPMHTFLIDSTYIVCMTAFSPCANDTVCDTLDVCETLTPNFTTTPMGQTITFNDVSGGQPIGWHWDFGDGNDTTGVQNPTHKYEFDGSYNVTLTVWNYCGDSVSYNSNTTIATKIDEFAFSNGVKVSPNPNNGQFNISLILIDNESVKLDVIDITGRIVYTENVSGKEGQNTVNVNLANAKGVYFIKLTSKLGTAVERVVIK